MKKLVTVIIILVLICSCLLFFYNIQLNVKTAEILFLSRSENRNSFILSYGKSFKLHRVADIENGISEWKISELITREEGHTVLPFKEGEMLIYDVYSTGIKAGQSVLTFHGEKHLNGEAVYYITFVTELPFFKDYEDIYAAKGSFLPIKIKRKIEKMGGFSTEEIEEEYDQAAFNVTVKKKGVFSSDKTVIQKDSHIYNSILLTYLCRANPEIAYKEDFRAVLPTQEFNIKISGEDKVDTPLGQYSVDVFTSEPPKFTFYLSKDEQKLPVKITSSTALNYTMVLNSVKNQN
jgi:hypothetical protein